MKAFSDRLRLTTVNALLKTAQHVEEGTTTKQIKQYILYHYEKDKNIFNGNRRWEKRYKDKNYDKIYNYCSYVIAISCGVAGMYIESKSQFSDTVSSALSFTVCTVAGLGVGLAHIYIISAIPVIAGVSTVGYVFRKMNKKKYD
jgi:hypothetical protein